MKPRQAAQMAGLANGSNQFAKPQVREGEGVPSPTIQPMHHLPPDVRPLYREYIHEALDGAIVQAEAACRFLRRGDDDRYVRQAVQRVVEFVKLAAAQTNELTAENQKPRKVTAVCQETSKVAQFGPPCHDGEAI